MYLKRMECRKNIENIFLYKQNIKNRKQRKFNYKSLNNIWKEYKQIIVKVHKKQHSQGYLHTVQNSRSRYLLSRNRIKYFNKKIKEKATN